MEHNKFIPIFLISMIVATVLYSNKGRIRLMFRGRLSKLNDAKDAEFIKEVGKEVLRYKKQYL